MNEWVIAVGISVAGLLVEIIVLIIAGVWAVGRIDASTQVLKQAMDTLTGSVEHLRTWLDQVNQKLAIAVERIAVIETKIEDLDCRSGKCPTDDDRAQGRHPC